MAVDSSGNVYVVDNSNHRIQKFTPPIEPVSAQNSVMVENTPYNNNKPTFTWTASTDALSGIDHYEVAMDGGAWSNIGTVTSYTWPTALSDSSHTISLKVVDKAGNPGNARLQFAG